MLLPADGLPAPARAEYPDEDVCLEWLWRRRFAVDGRTAICPRCRRPTRFYRLRSRRAYACDRCGRQLYPTADTPFSGTSTPLAVWYRAAHELSHDALSISGSELATRLGVEYRTALSVRRRLVPAFSDPGMARLLSAAGEWYAARADRALPAAMDPDAAMPESPLVDAILHAASRGIAKHGLEAARVADVAREAGTTSATVRRLFRTKQDLLLACFRRAEERLASQVEEMMQNEEDPRRRLRGLIELSLANPGDLRDEYLLWLEVWVRVRERAREVDEAEVFYGAHQALLETIRQGRASGVFRPTATPEAIAESFIALSDGLAFKTVEGYWEMTLDRCRELLHTFCEQMLGLAPGTLDE